MYLKPYPLKLIFFTFCICLLFSRAKADSTLIKFGSAWKYLDIGSAAPTGAGAADWRNAGFNDVSWMNGNAEFGYGESDERTTVSFGGNAANKYTTTYFRKIINIPNIALYGSIRINAYIDDGAVVYINGTEVGRDNMPVGAPAYGTLASAAAAEDGKVLVSFTVSTASLISGNNCIAVEVHQNSISSSDLSFDLELIAKPAASSTYLINYGASWKYLDNGTNQGTAWKDSTFNDASWATGPGQLGYGDGDEATTVSFGGNAANKYITTYFRKKINFDPASFGSITGNIKRDDGCVIYVNGQQVFINNLTAPVSFNTLAANATDDGVTPQAFSIGSSYFVNGDNYIAVEVHQNTANSSDISFDLELIGQAVGVEPDITRGPLLQMVSGDAVTIKWQTNSATNSRVIWGTDENNLTNVITDNTAVTNHELRITGLNADTKYYYGIGSTTSIQKASYRNYFITAPAANSTRKIRVAVFGDAGTGNASQKSTRDAYLELKKGNINSELAIMLGDNAYNSGTEGEHQTGFFNIYDDNVFDNHVVFSVPGNHEYANAAARANDHVIPYYDVFTLPAAAESGGLASGTEHYYSFDYGNIHFIMLDSYGYDGGKLLYDSTGQQALWLKDDLAANTKKWTIVCLHHPPYTNGTHFSNSETDLIAIRQQITPILERYGVDAVLAGHSHVYERSFLIQGHTGNSASFNNAAPPTGNLTSGSSARYDGSANSCPYFTVGGQNNHGTVYVVAGSAGQIGGGTNALYPAFYYRNYSGTTGGEAGALYLEIEDNRLDAKFVGASGTVRDQFTIMKDVNRKTTVNMVVNTTQLLNASWVGGYNWYTTPFTVVGNSKGFSFTPTATGNYTYYVRDSINPSTTCLADTFNIQVNSSLAVSLINFEVLQKNETALARWTTAFEQDNDFFTIERSANGRDFSFFMTVPGAGNASTPSSYEFIDIAPLPGMNYYRLIQKDKNGKSTILGVRSVNFKSALRFTMSIQPNPAINGTVNMFIHSDRKQTLEIRVTDINGAVVYKTVLKANNGKNPLSFSLNSGSYVISMQSQDGKRLTEKLIVK